MTQDRIYSSRRLVGLRRVAARTCRLVRLDKGVYALKQNPLANHGNRKIFGAIVLKIAYRYLHKAHSLIRATPEVRVEIPS